MYKEYGFMKKTTVFIDEQLLKEAMEAIRVKTKKEAIRAGLEALVRRHHRVQKELGTFDLDLNLEELEKLRNAE
jgi:Arc/MetJ family transcription regulator